MIYATVDSFQARDRCEGYIQNKSENATPGLFAFICKMMQTSKANASLSGCSNIGITHVFSCINICRVPRMLFEIEADRPSVQTSSEGPGKC